MSDEWIRDRFDKLETKIDALDSKLDNIVTTQVSQAKDIQHHIKRTDDLQNIVETLHDYYKELRGAMKVLTGIIMLYSLVQALKYFATLF